MVRTTATLSALLLTMLFVAGPALAEQDPEDDGPVPCVTFSLIPPDVHVDVECIKDLLPPPPPSATGRTDSRL